MKKQFYSNGKLLLTGEYLVLDGATALAIPTKKGQSLTVTPSEVKGIQWKSYNHEGNCWYEAEITTNLNASQSNDTTTKTLINILQQAKEINPLFLSEGIGYSVTTHLDFPRNWGLGSSSTLINNIAQWADVDAHTLLRASFGGSGYDIAAAQHNTPIFYSLANTIPEVRGITLPWNFKSHIYFVHLNKKQDSKAGISRYKKATITKQQIVQISDLTKKMLLCYTLSDFEKLLCAHEDIIASIIGLPKVKDTLFPDYTGTVKSLGAWGGDFVLATGNPESILYFKEKGYKTVLPFKEMAL